MNESRHAEWGSGDIDRIWAAYERWRITHGFLSKAIAGTLLDARESGHAREVSYR